MSDLSFISFAKLVHEPEIVGHTVPSAIFSFGTVLKTSSLVNSYRPNCHFPVWDGIGFPESVLNQAGTHRPKLVFGVWDGIGFLEGASNRAGTHRPKCHFRVWDGKYYSSVFETVLKNRKRSTTYCSLGIMIDSVNDDSSDSAFRMPLQSSMARLTFIRPKP